MTVTVLVDVPDSEVADYKDMFGRANVAVTVIDDFYDDDDQHFVVLELTSFGPPEDKVLRIWARSASSRRLRPGSP